MSTKDNRRSFLKKVTLGGLTISAAPGGILLPAFKKIPSLRPKTAEPIDGAHSFNGIIRGNIWIVLLFL